MPKYRVLGNCTLVCTMDVIADSGDEAIEIANDETCPRCRCVFVACEIDSYKDGLGGKDWVKCPECREEIELKEQTAK